MAYGARHLYKLPNVVYSLSNVAQESTYRNRDQTLIKISIWDLRIRENEHLSTMWRYEPLVRYAHSSGKSLEDQIGFWCFCQVSGRYFTLLASIYTFQALFFMVFAARYVDLFTSYISAYNTTMKCLFLFISFLTVYFCYIKFRSTYDEEGDK